MNSIDNKKNNQIAFFYLFVGIFAWATIEITIVMLKNQKNINPITINFFRIFLGGLIILIYLIITGRYKNLISYVKKYPLYYIPASAIGLVAGLIIYTEGTMMTKASYAATIFSTNPIIISILSIYFLKEKITKNKIIGIFFGFFGVLLMITELNFSYFFNIDNLLGNFLVFIGMCLWCIDIILGKAQMNKARKDNNVTGYESEYFNFLTMICAALIMSPFLIITGEFNILNDYNTKIWFGLFYLGIVTTGIGYVLFFKGLNKMEASKGINVFYLKPIIATILSFFILHEIPNNYLYIGIIIEIVALILISRD